MNPTVDFTQLPLRDIHLPGALSWWPPAVGWWLVAALAVAALGLAGLHYYRSRQWRAALRALDGVRAALERGAEPVGCLARVSTVLRRFAMTTADRDQPAPTEEGGARAPEVAGLIGPRWLRYLDSRWRRDDFSRGAGRLLARAPYARPESIDRRQALDLTALCIDWLKAQPRGRRAGQHLGAGALLAALRGGRLRAARRSEG
jgi:hypothetical protein